MAEDAADDHIYVAEGNEGADERDPGGTIRDDVANLLYCLCAVKLRRLFALLLFIIFVAVSVAFTVNEYLQGSQLERFTKHYYLTFYIMVLEITAFFAYLLLMRCASTRRVHGYSADADRFTRRNVKLFSIVPFFFAIVVFDVLRLIAGCACFDAWMACSSSVLLDHVDDLFYPVVRLLFLFVELIACIMFNAAVFNVQGCEEAMVLVALAVVQAANFASWLNALAGESILFSSAGNWTYELSRCFNGTDGGGNVAENSTRCFSRTTREDRILESASPYLYPFIMEYLMLVMECVAGWFFSGARGAPSPPANGPEAPEHGESVASGADNGSTSRMVPSTSRQQQPQQEAIASVSHASASDSTDGDHEGDTTPLIGAGRITGIPAATTDIPRCPWFFISVVMMIIFGVLFLILGIVHLCLGTDWSRYVFTVYRIIYWLLMALVVPLVGYVVSRRFPSRTMDLTGFEYFVLFSFIGPITPCVLTIIANWHTEDSVVPTGLFLAEELANALQMLTQFLFYAHAKTIQIGTGENDYKRLILMVAISSFAVCNFVIWAADSFIETRNAMTSWQKYYFDNWPVIYNVFNPLALMFRFNSALLFLNVYFDVKTPVRTS